MATKSATMKQNAKIEEFMRLGGAKIPAGFAAKAKAATKSLLEKRLKSENTQRMQAAKLYSELQGAAGVDISDPTNKKTLDELLSSFKKMAGKKLAIPKAPVGVGGFLPGTIAGTVAPPFDFADTIPTVLAGPTPPMSVSASINGQLSASVTSLQAPGFNGGNEYARVGIFFHPMTTGTLTISAKPTYLFEWLTNSLNTSFVLSSGSVGLTIYGLDEFGHVSGEAGENAVSWQVLTTGEVNFGAGFDETMSLSASAQVDSSLVYLCFVEVDAGAAGVGWPGSLALAMASATVPSISYEFVPRLVVEGF